MGFIALLSPPITGDGKPITELDSVLYYKDGDLYFVNEADFVKYGLRPMQFNVEVEIRRGDTQSYIDTMRYIESVEEDCVDCVRELIDMKKHRDLLAEFVAYSRRIRIVKNLFFNYIHAIESSLDSMIDLIKTDPNARRVRVLDNAVVVFLEGILSRNIFNDEVLRLLPLEILIKIYDFDVQINFWEEECEKYGVGDGDLDRKSPHPNVSYRGDVCWGALVERYLSIKKTGRLDQLYLLVRHFLSFYNPASAYSTYFTLSDVENEEFEEDEENEEDEEEG